MSLIAEAMKTSPRGRKICTALTVRPLESAGETLRTHGTHSDKRLERDSSDWIYVMLRRYLLQLVGGERLDDVATAGHPLSDQSGCSQGVVIDASRVAEVEPQVELVETTPVEQRRHQLGLMFRPRTNLLVAGPKAVCKFS